MIGWQLIKSAPDSCHMRTFLAYWTKRGVCETYWDVDDDFAERPHWWPSPEQGWRSPGDQCIPINQADVTHWMPLPSTPAIATMQGGE